MTDCPTDSRGVAECAQELIESAARFGSLIHIDTRPPDDPNAPSVTYICTHGTSYWVTPVKES